MPCNTTVRWTSEVESSCESRLEITDGDIISGTALGGLSTYAGAVSDEKAFAGLASGADEAEFVLADGGGYLRDHLAWKAFTRRALSGSSARFRFFHFNFILC